MILFYYILQVLRRFSGYYLHLSSRFAATVDAWIRCDIMSKITKWKLEKNKVKVVFRLQFHATHVWFLINFTPTYDDFLSKTCSFWVSGFVYHTNTPFSFCFETFSIGCTVCRFLFYFFQNYCILDLLKKYRLAISLNRLYCL